MILFTDLYNYFIDNDNIRVDYSKEYHYYNKLKKDFIIIDKFSNRFEKLSVKLFTKLGFVVEIPTVSSCSLDIQFIEAFNNPRMIDYLNLFGEEKFNRHIAAGNITFNLGEKFSPIETEHTTEDGKTIIEISDALYFNYEQLKPIIQKWGENNNIEIFFNYYKPEGYILDNPEIASKLPIPTDGICLNSITSNILLEDSFFDYRTYQTVDIEEANKFPYTNCILLPYIPKIEIYKKFLDEKMDSDIREELLKSDNFEYDFITYIDHHHYLFDEYCDYSHDYLKTIAIKWCNEHDIKYIDDKN